MESKAYRLGTHRTSKPRETLARLEPLLTQMGITRVANVTGLDRIGIPVYNACRPLSLSISVSQGKGSEALAAKVSAIMESVESFHAENIALPVMAGSPRQLQRRYHLADTENIARAGSQTLTADTSIHWIEGTNLFDQRPCWVPLEPVTTDYRYPSPPGNGYFAANTNGLASGNTLSEATCHAIYEVVERDAEAIWSQRPDRIQAKTGFDPDSVDDPNCRWLLEKFAAADCGVRIWDLTSDVGLPCFTCLVMGNEHDWADPETGTGCHASKTVALARALSEAAQVRATFIAGSRDDIGLPEYRHAVRQKRRTQGLRQFATHQPIRRFSQIASFQNAYIEDDLQLCLKQLENIGIQQIIAVDLSKPEFGIPVVKVVVPGLEGAYGHWHGAYVPGRRARELLELPFKMSPIPA